MQKSCANIIELFDALKSVITPQILDLIEECKNNEGSTEDKIFNRLLNCFKDHAIPLSNLVEFAANGV